MTRFQALWRRMRAHYVYRQAKLKWIYWTVRYRQDIKELYRHMAPNYDLVFNGSVTTKRYNEFFEFFLTNLDLQNAVVLDAGIGTGLLADWMTPLARRVVGIDVSVDQLHILKYKGSRKLDPMLATIEDIPVADQTCDVVTTCGTMGMMAFCYFDEERGIAEMARVLKIGGQIGVWLKFCLPRPRPWLQRLVRWLGWTLYDEESLRELFERYGLKLDGQEHLSTPIRYQGQVYFGVKSAHLTPHLQSSSQSQATLAESLS